MQRTFTSFIPRGLGAQLALAFSLLSVVLTIALILVVERRAIDQIKDRIGHNLADLAAQTSDKLERGMFERYREIALVTSRPVLTTDEYSLDQRRQALERVQRSYDYYEWIGLTDTEGKVLVSGNRLLEGADVSKRPWFIEGMRGGYVGDVHEALLLDKLLPPQADKAPRRFVDVAFPYADENGKVRGVLGAHLSWNWARDVERSVVGSADRESDTQTLILSSTGRVLLGPRELMDTTLALDSFRNASPTQRGAFMVERWPDGKDYVVGFQKGSGYASYPGLGWVVLVRQQVDTAWQPLYDMRRHALVSGLLLALLFSLVGVALARRITRPLKQLAASAGELRGGGAVQIASGGPYEEVKALSSSLNLLVQDLGERRRQLQQLNGTLEQMVESRTVELRRALETVQGSESRIRAIVDTAQDAFIGVDLKGCISEWNPQAEQMLGWRRAEALGRRLDDLNLADPLRTSDSDALPQLLASNRQGALDRRVERVVTDRHGAEIPVEMSTSLTGEGDSTMLSIFLRDITERKRIDRAKNEFVGTVSHELRTPLTSIRASLSLLADGAMGELTPDVQELIDICYNNCIRLNRLVDDMLDIQKIEAGMMSFVPVSQPVLPLAREAIRTMQGMATANDVSLVLDTGADASEAVAAIDYDRMTQVMTNLLSNAIKVAPGGSAVILHVIAQAHGARLSVADRGPGIRPELRERVFQPFVQIGQKDGGKPRTGGTGLGLAICKRIVEEHGGTISIADAPGGGTVFHVTLPREVAPSIVKAAATA
ncbi:sensor histidine kinase [Massilia brevitalea]|uniref:sensor histidine kinase n=1 Tax=Massilia brevitalea TaxID=442526 RepID=UPI0027385D86|nr:ATP-binding protein [Massilia brevitalea]